MNMTKNFRPAVSPALLMAAALMAAPVGALAQVSNPEVEPNNTKAGANAFTLSPGDSITGTTTGTSTVTAGAVSADYFRVTTVAAPAGIYRYRMQLSPSTTAWTGTLRGLSQTGGVPNVTTDLAVQASIATSIPARFNQWYGFGAPADIYYRVSGAATTTALYTATLERQPVTPIVVAGTIVEGDLTIRSGLTNTADTDLWIYDANFNAIPGFGNDDEPAPGTSASSVLTRNFAPGTYYVAIANWNTANNQASPTDDSFTAGNVLDFPGVIANSSAGIFADMGIQITGIAGTVTASGAKSGPFDVVWYQFTVSAATAPTPPQAAVGTDRVLTRAGESVLLTVATTPGTNPTSTGLTVTADLSGISVGGAANAQLFDNGTNGDLFAGDGIFSRAVTIAPGTETGRYTLTATVTDGQGRTGRGTGGVNVAAAGTTLVEDDATAPNDSKDTASTVNGMIAGQTIVGVSTGATLLGAGATDSVDVYRLNLPQRSGITKYRLALTSPATGHSLSLRGLDQNAGVIVPGSNVFIHFGAAPGNVVQFYGMGSETPFVYVAVAGTAGTQAPYTLTLTAEDVIPAEITGTVVTGPVTLSTVNRTGATQIDTALAVYDSSFNIIPEYLNDDAPAPSTSGGSVLTRTFAPGTYYIGVTDFTTANGTGLAVGVQAPLDDRYRDSLAMDSTAVTAGASATANVNVSMAVQSVAGEIVVPQTKVSPLDVVFTRLVVTEQTGIGGLGVATPGTRLPGLSTLLTVSVAPAPAPASTGITVRADLSAVGGSATAVLFDDGTNGDVTAGDNVFSLLYQVPSGTAGGAYSLPFTVRDAQSRQATGAIGLNVVPVLDLGTLSGSELTGTVTVAAGEIKWLRFTTTFDAIDPTRLLDIHTIGSTVADTEIGVYTVDGTLVADDDDSAAGLLSQLSFGNIGPREAIPGPTGSTAGAIRTGIDGPLTAGTYYIAAGAFNTTFGAADFNATSTATATGNIVVTLLTDGQTGPVGCNVADIVGIGGAGTQPDGQLTGDDFNAFIGAFAGGDLLADIVGIGGVGTQPDGQLTGDDFNAFINAFASGCP